MPLQKGQEPKNACGRIDTKAANEHSNTCLLDGGCYPVALPRYSRHVRGTSQVRCVLGSLAFLFPERSDLSFAIVHLRAEYNTAVAAECWGPINAKWLPARKSTHHFDGIPTGASDEFQLERVAFGAE